MQHLPFVSCLMVTPGNDARWPHIQRSVDDFCRQTHGQKELVIILDNASDADSKRLEGHLVRLNRNDIHVFQEGPEATLGVLRNSSVRHAQGPILCQWDDDDLHHPKRIELQLAELLRKDAGAVYLSNIAHLFVKTREIYWVNWGLSKMRGLPGTVMFRKDAKVDYPNEGQFSERGEDSDMLSQLNKNSRVVFYDNPIGLYFYLFNGSNTFQYDHHRFLATRFAEGREFMKLHKKELDDALAAAQLELEHMIVMDQQGVAWSWKPAQ
jgi:glycosyltransferase involved in cell wall biosynthesis